MNVVYKICEFKQQRLWICWWSQGNNVDDIWKLIVSQRLENSAIRRIGTINSNQMSSDEIYFVEWLKSQYLVYMGDLWSSTCCIVKHLELWLGEQTRCWWKYVKKVQRGCWLNRDVCYLWKRDSLETLMNKVMLPSLIGFGHHVVWKPFVMFFG